MTSYPKAERTCYQNFNSHAHVERDFGVQVSLICMNYFNSHAHVERDASLGEFEADQNISTHTLTWSVTTQERQEKEQERHFNSHAHVERDRYDVLL